MGVYARDHAQQMILDRAPDPEAGDVTSALSPRAQLLLLHIALKFGGDQDIKNRDVTKGSLWKRDALYLEGLGKKARAIGYNVPEKIDTHPAAPNHVSVTTSNRVKAAVNKAVSELLGWGLLVQTHRGQTGMTATYDLRFLRLPCAKCRTEGGMNETLHLSDDQREEEFDRIAQSRVGGQTAEDIGWAPRWNSNPGGWPQ